MAQLLDEDERLLLTQTVEACGRLEKGLADTTQALNRKIITAAAAVLIALVASGAATWSTIQTRDLVRGQARDRAEARVSVCKHDNDQLLAFREALPGALLALVPNPQKLTDDQLLMTLRPEQVESYRSYRARTEADLQPRLCDPASIDEFYRQQQPTVTR